MKRFISIVIIICMAISCMVLPASAAVARTSYYIDNDSADTSNCYNVRYGYVAYINDSDYYNGDLRRTYSSNNSDSYAWMRYSSFSNRVKNEPIYLTVGVYLKSSVLSDTAAHYFCQQQDGGYGMFYQNQATDANGWSYHSYKIKINHQTPGWFCVKGVCVFPSGIGSGYSAADAIFVSANTETN